MNICIIIVHRERCQQKPERRYHPVFELAEVCPLVTQRNTERRVRAGVDEDSNIRWKSLSSITLATFFVTFIFIFIILPNLVAAATVRRYIITIIIITIIIIIISISAAYHR